MKKKLIKNLFFLCSALMSMTLFAEFQKTKNPIIDPIDKERVEKFLKHVMIENEGIYTLLGSKPMTTFSTSPFIDDEEKQVMYAAQSEQFKKYIFLKKFTPCKADCQQLWKDWKKVEKKYIGNQFLFVEFEKWEEGILINIPSVAFILNKYRDAFVKITGQQFDPNKVIYQIGKSSDLFWSKVEENHYLLGLLLGFGEKNAQYFQWENDKGKHYQTRRLSAEDLVPDKNPRNLTIEDLIIPPFVIYTVIDDQVEKYKMEREQIVQLYQNQDFAEFTVNILKGESK